MDRAREKKNIDVLHWADQENPNNPRKGLVCGHFACAAQKDPPEVDYRSASLSQGDDYGRVPCYATKPNQRKKHHFSCDLVSEFDEDANSETLRQAIDAGKLVLLNLNLNRRKKGRRGEKSSRQENTEYARWCRDNAGNYHAVSITSVQKYLSVRDSLIRHGGDEIFDQVMVGYKSDIRTHAQFDIGSSKEKMRVLYEGMKSKAEKILERKPSKQGDAHFDTGFPRLLVFQPTYAAQKSNYDAKKIPGTAIFLERNEGAKQLLVPRLYLRTKNGDKDLRKEVLGGQETILIAEPWIHREQSVAFDRQFEAAASNAPVIRNIWPYIGWTVFSNNQFAVMPKVDQTPACEQENKPVPKELSYDKDGQAYLDFG